MTIAAPVKDAKKGGGRMGRSRMKYGAYKKIIEKWGLGQQSISKAAVDPTIPAS
jgi:hypothetical protein